MCKTSQIWHSAVVLEQNAHVFIKNFFLPKIDLAVKLEEAKYIILSVPFHFVFTKINKIEQIKEN